MDITELHFKTASKSQKQALNLLLYDTTITEVGF